VNDQPPKPVFRTQPVLPGMSPSPNEIVEGDGFHVSYNCVDGEIYGCDTTALVIGQMEAFYILDGDHRQAYAALVPQGLKACLGYFEDNIDRANKRSDFPPKENPGQSPGADGPGM